MSSSSSSLWNGPSSQTKALCVLWVLGWVAAGCTGPERRADSMASVAKSRPHMAQVGDDATLVVTFKNPAERAKVLQEAPSWARLKQVLQSGQAESAETQEMLSKADKLTQALQDHLPGRLTLAMYAPENLPGADEELLVVMEGDVKQLLDALAAVDGAPPVVAQPHDGGLFHIQDAGVELDFYWQAGEVGYLATNPELLRAVQSRLKGDPARSLSDNALFVSSTEGLDMGAELFAWGLDWSEAEEDWGGMLDTASAKEGKSARPFAAAVNLTGGIDAQGRFDVGDDFTKDADFQKFLPALTKVNTPPAIPSMLPKDVLFYTGLSIDMASASPVLDELAQGDTTLALDEFAKMRQDLQRAWQGEAALVAFGPKAQSVPSLMLGMVPPDAALVVRLSDPKEIQTVERIMGFMMPLVASASDGALIAPGAPVVVAGVQATSYTTADPSLPVLVAFHPDGYMLVGTTAALEKILGQRATTSKQGALSRSGISALDGMLSGASNFRLHVDLKDAYVWALGQFGGPLELMTDGLLGSPGDPLTVVLDIFRHLGGSVRMGERHLDARAYVTIEED